MPRSLLEGGLFVLIGTLAIILAPWIGRMNRALLQKDTDFEQGTRWTNRIAGVIAIAVGFSRVVGWW